MEPPPPPPPSVATPTTTTTYPDSVESSPRSRTTDSWAVDPTSDLLPQKLRLMCSYGGHIVPRPHDKSLCYVGGDTRMIVVDRNSTTLSSLSSHLSKTLLNNRPFTLKYQLPNEDLDSLITVSTEEDLENMIEEYDRTVSSHSTAHKPSRLRLFLFPLMPDSSQSIGPLLDSSAKSDDWFLSALNGAGLLNRGFSDSAPVNFLGLDDDLGMNNTDSGSRDADVNSSSLPGSFGNEKSGKHSQDVHSVPDSPMLETTSSFGSTSSSPSIANLPPVRVVAEERVVSDQRLGIEEQFAQMVMGSNSASGGGQKQQVQVQEEGYVVMGSGAVTGNITVTGMPVGVAPGDYSGRVYSDDERSDHGVPIGYRKLPPVGQQSQQQQPQVQGQPPQQVQSQQKSVGGLELPSPDSVSSDGSLTNPLSRSKPVMYQEQAVQMPSGINRVSANQVEQKINVSDPHAGLQLQQHIQEAGYVLQQPQVDQRQPQQPQQQFIHAGAHYIHHATGSLPVATYYPTYPSQHHPIHPHQLEQQYSVYYMPVSQAPAYNISSQQPNAGETTSAIPPGRPQTPPNPAMVPQTAAYNPIRNAPSSKPEIAASVYRMGAAGAPQIVQVPSSQHQQQQLYYTQQQQIHHQSQSVAPASGGNATYAYEFTNPPHHQIYYTQPLAPTLPSQYQTMNAANPIVLPDASGQIPTDNIKQQMRTSQPS